MVLKCTLILARSVLALWVWGEWLSEAQRLRGGGRGYREKFLTVIPIGKE